MKCRHSRKAATLGIILPNCQCAVCSLAHCTQPCTLTFAAVLWAIFVQQMVALEAVNVFFFTRKKSKCWLTPPQHMEPGTHNCNKCISAAAAADACPDSYCIIIIIIIVITIINVITMTITIIIIKCAILTGCGLVIELDVVVVDTEGTRSGSVWGWSSSRLRSVFRDRNSELKSNSRNWIAVLTLTLGCKPKTTDSSDMT